MATKKSKKKKITKKKAAAKPARKKAPKKKAAAKPKKPARKKIAAKKSSAKSRPAPAKKRGSGKSNVFETPEVAGRFDSHEEEGGQSGDTQGLSKTELADSESVTELAEEGQDFEAEAIEGVENALDPDVSEVKTREVLEDDVPEEYDNQ